MSTNTVQEPAVMANYKSTAGKIFQSLFQSTNSFYV